ncbi:hypothetical protein FNF28_07372 [Cafeteria roenbergensis]|uniref:PX domain-containing protein n=1 Tax=Cafeteria roenbergensis TaxID=33653 RepID=A0A5A8C9J3_CAFRO|nr:hypothetical protein FNF28_07372 [Cafeteria roenbergensis]
MAAAAAAADSPIYTEIRRWRTSPDGSFSEFEVACRTNEKDRVTLRVLDIKWSVFRRYSEFADLDKSLRHTYGYQMNSIKLPGKRLFGNKRPEFLDERQAALQQYLRGVLRIRRIADFAGRAGFSDLRAFLAYDARHAGMAETGMYAVEQTDADEVTADGSTVATENR